MEQILDSLQDPFWWFNIVSAAIVALVLGRVGKILDTIRGLPKRLVRWNEKRTLLMVKRYRQHEIRIAYLIARYWCAVAIWTQCAVLVLVLYLAVDLPSAAFWLLVLPMYVSQIGLVLAKRTLVLGIRHHIRWRRLHDTRK